MEDKLNDQKLEDVAGGAGFYPNNPDRRRVSGLQTGYLAMRSAPTYDFGNEIRGAELYNGDVVFIRGAYTQGYDGRTYVTVFAPKNGVTGYVNASFLAW